MKIHIVASGISIRILLFLQGKLCQKNTKSWLLRPQKQKNTDNKKKASKITDAGMIK